MYRLDDLIICLKYHMKTEIVGLVSDFHYGLYFYSQAFSTVILFSGREISVNVYC